MTSIKFESIVLNRLHWEWRCVYDGIGPVFIYSFLPVYKFYNVEFDPGSG